MSQESHASDPSDDQLAAKLVTENLQMAARTLAQDLGLLMHVGRLPSGLESRLTTEDIWIDLEHLERAAANWKDYYVRGEL